MLTHGFLVVLARQVRVLVQVVSSLVLGVLSMQLRQLAFNLAIFGEVLIG